MILRYLSLAEPFPAEPFPDPMPPQMILRYLSLAEPFPAEPFPDQMPPQMILPQNDSAIYQPGRTIS
jgi:hypothetical protein